MQMGLGFVVLAALMGGGDMLANFARNLLEFYEGEKEGPKA